MDEFKAVDKAAMDKVALTTKEISAVKEKPSTLHLDNRKGILKARTYPSIAVT